MSYDHIEQLLSRRGEKVAAFLTVENAVGMAVFGLPFFLIDQMPMLVRAAAIVLGSILGFLLTNDTQGMMFCERMLWRVRGLLRPLMQGSTLAPEQLPGVRTATTLHRAVRRDEAVRKSRRHRAAAGPVAEHIVRRRAAAPAREVAHADSSA
ncbi:MAG: hypothetical protein H7Z42_17485 [Roseiflexaceae bacterium]|nr:hypothetical protein [Roseiflexaceae bacterium]